MKPLRLELQAFGPFVEKQVVDFEKLSEKGMFLIKGNTGSGKTTIFDAMTFALYGGGSGENDTLKIGRNDLKEWRCTQAERNLDTVVSFTFSVRERKYVFTRRLIQKTKNLSEKYEAGEIAKDGNIIPFFDNPKKADLNKKAEELVGLTKEQFRQVVLLPQGQFERFLTASSNEKEEILQKIFGSEQWTKYTRKFFDDALARKNTLDEEKKEIDNSLAEEDVLCLEQLEEKIQLLEEEKKELQRIHQEFDGEGKQKKLDEDRELSEGFKPLHEAEKILCGLKEKKDFYDEKQREYEQAEKAEALREPIRHFEDACTEQTLRNQELLNTQKGLKEAEELVESTRIAKEEHEKNSPIPELTKTLGNYESKKAAYQEAASLKTAAKTVAKELKTAQEKLKQASNSLKDATETAKTAKKDYDEADTLAKAYRDRYFAGIYGEIAGTLEEGKKCPVCGSFNHPEPAKKHPDSVSKEDVDEKETSCELKKNLWNEAEIAREQAEQEKNQKQKDYNEKDGLKRAADAKLEAAEKNLIEGITDSKALTKKITDIQTAIKNYKEETETRETSYSKAVMTLNELKGKIDSAKKEKERADSDYEKADGILKKALKEKDYEDYKNVKLLMKEDSERKQLHEELVSYKTSCEVAEKNLEKLQKKLEGKTEPDSSLFEERKEEIDAEKVSFAENNANYEQEIKRLTGKYRVLSVKAKDYADNITEAGNDLAFAKKLRGDSGIGLQRYVLAIMFNQVIGEANRMLEKVHGGRYYLYRSDDKGIGNKRGLELKVHDSRSPEKEGRSVGMLSGGEKFLVSLALSIGMSTIAQKSGVQIEALFIDEGFGTLDDNSINDAMDVLDSVRKGDGMIGIISHVQLLEANISTHLEVIKSETGSSIALR
ncbi:MAG: SMC family ATPase [Lachnospiraceae bacterium]|nr:SMC family ATPase [Lachnospiraceae bacterium]